MERLCRKTGLCRRAGSRYRQRGEALVETLLCFFVLFLVLFGMIHVSYFFLGQYFADYASLRGARSRIVGFVPYLIDREARINAIGGSGAMVDPPLSSLYLEDSKYTVSQYQLERTLIQRFMVGSRYLEYQYWYGNNPGSYNNSQTSSPNSSPENAPEESSRKENRTTFHVSSSLAGSYMCQVLAYFDNYSSVEHYIGKMFFGKNLRLEGKSVLADHSRTYLD